MPFYRLYPRIELPVQAQGAGERFAFSPGPSDLGDTKPRQIRMIPTPPPAEGSRCVAELEVGDSGDTVFFVGAGAVRGGTDYVCGQCRAILVEQVRPRAIKNVVLQCAACGTYNDSPEGSNN